MANKKADRATLKGYFRKNLVPTESNFADLIDGMLNQTDDGIDKPPGDPLRIAAAGDAAGPQKLINFYGNLGDANPAWTLQLNPRSDQNDPATAKAGFSISNGQGASRLFIDRNTGNVGIGTTSSPQQLSLTGGIGFANQNATDKKLYSPKDGLLEWMTFDSETEERGFAVSHQGELRVLLRSSGNSYIKGGNVGIGTDNPKGGLHIANSGKQWGSFNYGTNVIVKGGTPQRNPAIGIFDYKDENPWAIVNGDGNLQFVQMPALGDTTTAPINRLTIDKLGSVVWSNNSCLVDNQGGSIELGGNNTVAGVGTPYIDFHYLGKTEDYNTRIINDADGRLSVDGSLRVTGNIQGDLKLTLTGSLDFGILTRQMINLWQVNYGIGVQNSTQYFRTGKNFAWYKGGAHTDTELDSGGGTIQMVIKDGNVGIGMDSPEAKLSVKGTAMVSDATAIVVGNMASGSLTMGSSEASYGGGSGWNANMAGLMLNTKANTEIAVHDSGQRISSLMFYEGDAVNQLTIGRDMGWGPLSSIKFMGAITPSAGNTEANGILFPKEPGGGGGDAAWMRYYPRTGESCTLEIGVSNDADDHIALMPSGGVGIGTTDPHKAKLYVEGSIKSPMWNIFQLFNSQPGGLPTSGLTSGQFITGGGTLLIIASGSGWSHSANTIIGMDIQIDGSRIGEVKTFTNEAGSHKAFICNPLVKGGIAAGSHTVTLVPITGTNTDSFDWFNVTVLEFPFQMPPTLIPFIVDGFTPIDGVRLTSPSGSGLHEK